MYWPSPVFQKLLSFQGHCLGRVSSFFWSINAPLTWSSRYSPSLFPEHSPRDQLGCNASCCYSYNSLPPISICPWLSALPSHFCSCPFKVWEHQRISCTASGFTGSLSFSSAEDHLRLQIYRDISEHPHSLETTFIWKSLTMTSGLSLLWSSGNLLS